eukprot:scaffold74423_cov27-Tisochrysis_lutea.AAC.9
MTPLTSLARKRQGESDSGAHEDTQLQFVRKPPRGRVPSALAKLLPRGCVERCKVPCAGRWKLEWPTPTVHPRANVFRIKPSSRKCMENARERYRGGICTW